jgi:hypothetical protein
MRTISSLDHLQKRAMAPLLQPASKRRVATPTRKLCIERSDATLTSRRDTRELPPLLSLRLVTSPQETSTFPTTRAALFLGSALPAPTSNLKYHHPPTPRLGTQTRPARAPCKGMDARPARAPCMGQHTRPARAPYMGTLIHTYMHMPNYSGRSKRPWPSDKGASPYSPKHEGGGMTSTDNTNYYTVLNPAIVKITDNNACKMN